MQGITAVGRTKIRRELYVFVRSIPGKKEHIVSNLLASRIWIWAEHDGGQTYQNNMRTADSKYLSFSCCSLNVHSQNNVTTFTHVVMNLDGKSNMYENFMQGDDIFSFGKKKKKTCSDLF